MLSASRHCNRPGGLLVDTTIDERRLPLTQKNDGFPSSGAGGRIGYGLLKWKLNSTGSTRELLVALVKAFSECACDGNTRAALMVGETMMEAVWVTAHLRAIVGASVYQEMPARQSSGCFARINVLAEVEVRKNKC